MGGQHHLLDRYRLAPAEMILQAGGCLAANNPLYMAHDDDNVFAAYKHIWKLSRKWQVPLH